VEYNSITFVVDFVEVIQLLLKLKGGIKKECGDLVILFYLFEKRRQTAKLGFAVSYPTTRLKLLY
jgi:hypothetical protein